MEFTVIYNIYDLYEEQDLDARKISLPLYVETRETRSIMLKCAVRQHPNSELCHPFLPFPTLYTETSDPLPVVVL
jgi:hypothetical protein